MAYDVRFTIDLTADQNATIENAAREVGLTKSAYIRQAVELMNWIAHNKNVKLVARDAETGESHFLVIPGLIR